jgi:hypothetical protein
MPKLTVTITNQDKSITNRYVIDCADRPGLDCEAYYSAQTIDLIRSVAERDQYLLDFLEPPVLPLMSATPVPGDPIRTQNFHNINELWLEVQNLLLGARVNLATARMLKELEDQYSSQSILGVNAIFDLHLEKMERFHLGVYELSRIEDLIVRIVYEFFGTGFIDLDPNAPDWEKRLTWDRMKESLNKRGKSQLQPHPCVEALPDPEYQLLMELVRSYRSPEVLDLVNYRDRRTHRVAPTVDHPELGVNVQPAGGAFSGRLAPLSSFRGGTRGKPEFDFISLYALSAKVYEQLVAILSGINAIIHA